MEKRLIVMGLVFLLSFAVTTQASGQQDKGHSTNNIDLKAKLKEAEANPHQLEALLKRGAKVASFCANCHGDGGNSLKSDVPNLAGQNASYLFSQLHQYLEQHRPTTDFKRRLIKVLSTDEKISLVAFYARQAVVNKPSSDAALVGKGKLLYQKYCSDCHENDGHGSEEFSRVAGQQTAYLTLALKGYRDNPNGRHSRDMTAVIKGMSDADINALVIFSSAMK